jgi:cytochrome P450
MKLIEGHRPIIPAEGIPVWDVDPYDETILRNPYDYYAHLRELGDVVYIPRYSVLAVGRYATTHKVFSDHEHFVSSRGVGLNDFALGKPWRQPSIILEVDPPEHTRTRKVMARVLSPKIMKTLSNLFLDIAEQVVDDIISKGSIEVVSELSEVYPTSVFPKAVGMKDVNARYLVDYGAMVFNGTGPDNEIRRHSMAEAGQIVPWITSACAR